MRPFYLRLLGIEHLRLRAWQRVLLGEGMIALGVVLALAEVASAWVVVVLPVVVALVVKVNDLAAGRLAEPRS